MKLNKKGYMLIEIILASIIAFGVAIFIINLTLRLKNKNDDELVESLVATDEAIVTNKLMQYAIAEKKEFNCYNIRTSDNKIYYTPKDGSGEILIDNINEYAEIKLNSEGRIKCTNEDGKIDIEIPLDIPQQPDKNYSINVEYKYEIGDYVGPIMQLFVDAPTTYAKSKTATIVISEENRFEAGTYYIVYDWSLTPKSCDSLSNVTSITITDDDVNNLVKEKSVQVTISNGTGAGKIYVCNDNPLIDYARNEKIYELNENMYLDNTGPTLTKGNYTGNATVKGTVNYPLVLSDGTNGSGVDYNSFTKEDLTVKIGTETITDFTITHNSGDSYSLTVNDLTHAGLLTIALSADSVKDNANNTNVATAIDTGVTFDNTYTLTVNKTLCSSVSGGGTFAYGTTNNITVTPGAGYDFSSWSYVGDKPASTSSTTTTVTITKNTTVTAICSTKRFSLTVNKGSCTNAVGSGTYPYNTSVTITATPGTSQDFSSWTVNSGNSPASTSSRITTITMTAVTVVTANCKAKPSSSGGGGGGGGTVSCCTTGTCTKMCTCTNSCSSGGSGGGSNKPKPSGGTCFPAGTKVVTSTGEKNINEIKIGDIVLTYNEGTGNNEYHKVINAKAFLPNEDNSLLYTLSFDDNTTLKVTESHRIYIKRNNSTLWLKTKDVKVGDIVMYDNKTTHRITNIEYQELTETVYNLSVEGTHNFYVGEKHILVHNTFSSCLVKNCNNYK